MIIANVLISESLKCASVWNIENNSLLHSSSYIIELKLGGTYFLWEGHTRLQTNKRIPNIY